jgi:catechol 2,3-dioxygenase-like lactoylglutathione lyase family enzyme
MDFDQTVTFLATDDLDSTARFYEEELGLELALDQGSCRIYRVASTGFLGFCERREAPEPDGVIATFVTDDVDGVHEQLVERGAEFEQTPEYNSEYDIYHCFLRDPNGYLLEIQRFEDPEWPSNDE